jgi:hypothetical protein
VKAGKLASGEGSSLVVASTLGLACVISRILEETPDPLIATLKVYDIIIQHTMIRNIPLLRNSFP